MRLLTDYLRVSFIFFDDSMLYFIVRYRFCFLLSFFGMFFCTVFGIVVVTCFFVCIVPYFIYIFFFYVKQFI